MGQMFSYVVGILVAGLIVFGLHFGMQIASPAYARQITESRVAEKSLDELGEIIRGGKRTAVIAAVTAVGSGDDQIEKRVKLIAEATANPDRSIQSICQLSVQRMGDRVKPGVRLLLDSSDEEEVRSACGIIHALGPKGDQYAEEMFKMMREGTTIDRHAALFSLQNMSPEVLVPGIDLVIEELNDQSFNTQCIACFVLRQMGNAAKPATERLVLLFQEGNVSARSRAAQALGAIGPVEGYDIPGLLAAKLVDDEAAVRPTSFIEKSRVMEALGDLGPDASDHLDKIEMLMQSPQKHCVCEAALAYYRVSGEADKSIPVLLGEVRKVENRISAIECIGGMGEAASEAVPALLEHLESEDLSLLETTILALKKIGPTAEDAMPKLEKLLENEDFLIAVAAQEAIDSIKGKSQDK